MTPEQAQRRLAEGGFIVILDAPVGFHIGVDSQVFTTGPRFQGIKMIPQGLHFLHYGLNESERQGMFLNILAGSVDILCWDATLEDLVLGPSQLPSTTIASIAHTVRSGGMDSSLGPYPLEGDASWANLAGYISTDVLSRCGIPPSVKLRPDTVDDKANGAHGDAIVPFYSDLARIARFTGAGDILPKERSGQVVSSGITPAEVTRRHMDRSEQILELLHSQYGGFWEEIMGEVQLAFVLFLLIASHGAYREWQELTSVLCRCEVTRGGITPAMYKTYLEVLYSQMKIVPEDFFSDAISKENFLVPSLSAMFQSIVGNSSVDRAVSSTSLNLLRLLQERFNIFLDVKAPPSSSTQQQQTDLLNHLDTTIGAFELCDEDLPVVVPYQEVVRVLGEENTPNTAPVVITDDEMSTNNVQHSSSREKVEWYSEARKANSDQDSMPVVSPAELKWREIDVALQQVKRQSNLSSTKCVNTSGMDVDMQDASVMPVTRKARIPRYSKTLIQKYPALFGSIDCNLGEDVMMAASRLVSYTESQSGHRSANAREEAISFLENEAADEKSEVWVQLYE